MNFISSLKDQTVNRYRTILQIICFKKLLVYELLAKLSCVNRRPRYHVVHLASEMAPVAKVGAPYWLLVQKACAVVAKDYREKFRSMKSLMNSIFNSVIIVHKRIHLMRSHHLIRLEVWATWLRGSAARFRRKGTGWRLLSRSTRSWTWAVLRISRFVCFYLSEVYKFQRQFHRFYFCN